MTFLYYGLLLKIANIFNEYTLNITMNSKILYTILISLITYLLFFFIKKSFKSFYFINIGFIIFSIVIITKYEIGNLLYSKYKNPESHPIKFKGNFKKPIILIIADEYSSPTELYKLYNDSNLYKFQNRLISKKWYVNNKISSENKFTINT